MSVDIGAEAINRSTYAFNEVTTICLDSPASISGKITSVEIWANTDITGMRVGTFYLKSGITYKCRASVVIGAVEAGAKRTFSSLSIIVEEGDYIGAYWETGRVDRAAYGFAGYYHKEGEYIDPGDETTYFLLAGDVISLGGYISAVAAGRSFGFIMG